jgi:FkbM family methyltransferase
MNNKQTEIKFKDIQRFWIKNTVSVVHCGAHLAEELEDYESLGWNDIIWIEANPRLITALHARLTHHSSSKVINATLWSESDKSLKLKIANNSYSTSALNFGKHSEIYPDITYIDEIEVISRTLDSVLSEFGDLNHALLVLDLQGVEKEVLQGAIQSLEHFDFIYLEVSKDRLYDVQAEWKDITKFLTEFDFKLVDWQYSKSLRWGNALYQRSPKKGQTVFRRIHRRFIHSHS